VAFFCTAKKHNKTQFVQTPLKDLSANKERADTFYNPITERMKNKLEFLYISTSHKQALRTGKRAVVGVLI